jgi:hypothetical protein
LRYALTLNFSVDPCPAGSATKCLDDFSKSLIKLLTTKNPDVAALCGSISTNQACAATAPAFCKDRIVAAMGVYISRANMLCATKEGENSVCLT